MPHNTSATTATLVLSGGWFVAGALWFAQALVPWTATGALSHSTTLDASALIRSGAVGALAPGIAGWFLLALPGIGLVLGASAFSAHPITRGFRVAAVVVAVTITAALTHYLTDFQLTSFGPGALLAWLGCATCIVVVVADLAFPSS